MRMMLNTYFSVLFVVTVLRLFNFFATDLPVYTMPILALVVSCLVVLVLSMGLGLMVYISLTVGDDLHRETGGDVAIVNMFEVDGVSYATGPTVKSNQWVLYQKVENVV